MTDVVDSTTRTRMMSGIRGVDTRPEKQIRSMLHRSGFRYALHRKDLPGKPDIVLPKYGAVIFVHGCFWHRHQCGFFKWPQSNSTFWRHKINANSRRDKENILALVAAGWRVMTIWECALRGQRLIEEKKLLARVSRWIFSKSIIHEIPKSAGGNKS